jgi:two-component system, OmpR family, sensor kinase
VLDTGCGRNLARSGSGDDPCDDAGEDPGAGRVEVGMPLKLRLAMLFALATAAVIGVAGTGFVLQLQVSVEASLDPGLRAQVAAVADELVSDAGPVLPGGAVDLVQLGTADGRVVASSPNAGTRPLLDPGQLAQALKGEISYTTTVNGDRTRMLAATVPGRRGPMVVSVGTGTDVADAAVDRATYALLLSGPPAAALAGLGAWLLAGAVLRPVERMRRQAARIGDQDLGGRLAVPATRDEIAALGTTMNALLARLQEALQRERGFVADAGHELRTPLAILHTELELAARPCRSREALVEAVTQAGRETDRLIRLTEDLLLLARADNQQPFLRMSTVSLPELLAAAVRGAGARSASQGVTVRLHTPPELDIDADTDRLRQAIDNLLDNATRYAPPETAVDVIACSSRPDLVTVAVRDRGAGFPPDFLPQAFERFRRAEAARTRDNGGTGLGLSIVQAIVRAHGGRVIAANHRNGGAIVTLELRIGGASTHQSGTGGAARAKATSESV